MANFRHKREIRHKLLSCFLLRSGILEAGISTNAGSYIEFLAGEFRQIVLAVSMAGCRILMIQLSANQVLVALYFIEIQDRDL